MIAFFVFGALLGGVIGFAVAILMQLTAKDEEKRNVRDE